MLEGGLLVKKPATSNQYPEKPETRISFGQLRISSQSRLFNIN